MIDVINPATTDPPEAPQTTLPTPTDIENFLDSLGATSQEVAESLMRLGIIGHRGMSSMCPLARLLDQHYSDHGLAYVSVGVGKGELALDWKGLNTVEFVVPCACARFICRFDRGDYPSLVDRESS